MAHWFLLTESKQQVTVLVPFCAMQWCLGPKIIVTRFVRLQTSVALLPILLFLS